MRFINLKHIFAIIILFSILLSTLSAQEPGGSHRDNIKNQVQFSRWQELLSTIPEITYSDYKLDSTTVSPWRIRRMQEIGAANSGSMDQYILVKSDEMEKAGEILMVSVTRCTTRAVAAEGLIDHLLGVQRPDFRLIEGDSLLIGDLAVNISDDSESAIYFFRGNILITIENAGDKAAADIRELARSLDDRLKEKESNIRGEDGQ